MSKKKGLEALSRRLEDLATGANGGGVGVNGDNLTSPDYCLATELGVPNFGKLLAAVSATWPAWSDIARMDITGFWSFEQWDQPFPDVVHWLYRLGVRADRDRE